MGESMGGSMIESRGESMVGSMGGSMIESRRGRGMGKEYGVQSAEYGGRGRVSGWGMRLQVHSVVRTLSLSGRADRPRSAEIGLRQWGQAHHRCAR